MNALRRICSISYVWKSIRFFYTSESKTIKRASRPIEDWYPRCTRNVHKIVGLMEKKKQQTSASMSVPF